VEGTFHPLELALSPIVRSWPGPVVRRTAATRQLSVEHRTVGGSGRYRRVGGAPEVTPVADVHDGPRGLATHDGLRLC
jgi:hypothetical protein